MTQKPGAAAEDPVALDHKTGRTRLLCAGEGWRISEAHCRAGPKDRAFEERHEGFTIAAVIAGTFTYRSERGRALFHPGALLLGNHGACFACGHDHGTGDRCIAVNIAPGLFEEIAAANAGDGGARFPTSIVPASQATLPVAAAIESVVASGDPLQIAESVVGLVSCVLRHVSGERRASPRVSARDERRVMAVVRHLEIIAAEQTDLGRLAALAEMSRFHFLRVFRATMGITPHQYLLNLRLRRAARCLSRSTETVTAVAFASGFGDLSTFNHHFKRHFGVNPVAYRKRRGGCWRLA